MDEMTIEVVALVRAKLGLPQGEPLTEDTTLVDAGVNSVDLLEIVYDLEHRYAINLWPLVKEQIKLGSSTLRELVSVVNSARVLQHPV